MLSCNILRLLLFRSNRLYKGIHSRCGHRAPILPILKQPKPYLNLRKDHLKKNSQQQAQSRNEDSRHRSGCRCLSHQNSRLYRPFSEPTPHNSYRRYSKEMGHSSIRYLYLYLDCTTHMNDSYSDMLRRLCTVRFQVQKCLCQGFCKHRKILALFRHF